MKFIAIVFSILQYEFVLLSKPYTLIGVHRKKKIQFYVVLSMGVATFACN